MHRALPVVLQSTDVLVKFGGNIVPLATLTWGQYGGEAGGRDILDFHLLLLSREMLFMVFQKGREATASSSTCHKCITLTHSQILRKIHRSQEIPGECSHLTLC